MRIIFFGSSEFSLKALEACLETPYTVPLVITTPDQKKGRGLQMMPTIVSQFCHQQNIPVEAPETLKNPDLIKKVAELAPDLFVVSSYGKLIPSDWLKIPSSLALNVHPSLLPKYRGASPVNWPIINGDAETGVSIAEVTDKLDAGDIFLQEKFPLNSRINSSQLSHQLAELSYAVLSDVLKQAGQGNIKRIPQQEELSCYARKLTKEDGYLSFQKTADELDRLIRGLQPWPGSYLMFQGEPLLVLEAESVSTPVTQKPGVLLEITKDGGVTVATPAGALKLIRVRPAGKKEMTAADFARGKRLQPGFVFESSSGAGTP